MVSFEVWRLHGGLGIIFDRTKPALNIDLHGSAMILVAGFGYIGNYPKLHPVLYPKSKPMWIHNPLIKYQAFSGCPRSVKPSCSIPDPQN
jgi:hypothetical protein